MLNALRRIFGPQEKVDAPDGVDPRIAAAALLVETALADGVYAGVEAQQIRECLKDAFDLTPDELETIMSEAEELASHAVDHHKFTNAVKWGLPKADRLKLMENLWKVALADGDRDAHEDQLLRRVAPLMALTDRDRAEARQRAESDRAG